MIMMVEVWTLTGSLQHLDSFLYQSVPLQDPDDLTSDSRRRRYTEEFMVE